MKRESQKRRGQREEGESAAGERTWMESRCSTSGGFTPPGWRASMTRAARPPTGYVTTFILYLPEQQRG